MSFFARRAMAALSLIVLAACTSQPARSPSATSAPPSATGSATQSPSETATPTASSSATAPAAVVVAALGATVIAGASASAMTAIATQRPAAVGDTVGTDAHGLGEFRFSDGSLERLGKSTTVVLTELTPAGVQRTRTALTLGDTWHSVQKLTVPGAAYEVATPVGVAAVRGTRFAVSCTPKKCIITVLEGTVQFTPTGGAAIAVAPFQRLQVPGDKAARTVTGGELTADPWITDNLKRDNATTVVAGAPNPAFSGRYQLATKILTSTAGPNSGFNTTPHVWTAVAACASGPCAVVATSDSGRVFPFVYADGQWVDKQTVKLQCRVGGSRALIPNSFLNESFALVLHIDQIKGAVATRLSGIYADHASQCNSVPGYGAMDPAYDETVSFVLTRLPN